MPTVPSPLSPWHYLVDIFSSTLIYSYARTTNDTQGRQTHEWNRKQFNHCHLKITTLIMEKRIASSDYYYSWFYYFFCILLALSYFSGVKMRNPNPVSKSVAPFFCHYSSICKKNFSAMNCYFFIVTTVLTTLSKTTITICVASRSTDTPKGIP